MCIKDAINTELFQRLQMFRDVQLGGQRQATSALSIFRRVLRR